MRAHAQEVVCGPEVEGGTQTSAPPGFVGSVLSMRSDACPAEPEVRGGTQEDPALPGRCVSAFQHAGALA